MTTSRAMDRLLVEAGGDMNVLKTRLGIPREAWNEELLRIDVFDPLLHNARLPSGLEPAANSLLRFGGYTSGGMPEAVLGRIPVVRFGVSSTGVGP